MLLAAALCAGCGASDGGDAAGPRAPGDAGGGVADAWTYSLTREQMLDPKSCAGCHPDHYREWSGSMHAYAAEDPVFLAMNRRGQRETSGALGSFCITCHAPMAVRLGATTDGLNLDDVPSHLKGVTCIFCHSVVAVEGTHNAPLVLADDGVLRGGISDPVATTAHGSTYSGLHDRNALDSAGLCGACHDIVTPAGVHLERTFQEWKGSLYAHAVPGEQQTCGACHMTGRNAPAAVADDVPVRRVHSHAVPGVDVALHDFPEREAQRAAVQSALDTTVFVGLCVQPTADGATIAVSLENFAAGHGWPSGAAQDRRAWVEIVAFAGDEKVLESGVVADGEPLLSRDDPALWRLGDTLRNADGELVHMFWEAASVTGELLPPPTAAVVTDPAWTDTHRARHYTVVGDVPTRVTVRVRIRPIGLDVLDDLIASKDLAPTFRTAMPTFTLRASVLEWTDQDPVCVP